MTTTEKTCFKCQEIKPVTEFYVHPAMGDRRLGKCKECAKADVRANYAANIEQYREYERGRAMLPHRVVLRKIYEATPAGKSSIRKSNRKYSEANPVKRRAVNMVNNAVRDGRLLKQQCEQCGNKAQAHHDDYSKPLSVRWLCPKHHHNWHKHNTPLCPDQSEAA